MGPPADFAPSGETLAPTTFETDVRGARLKWGAIRKRPARMAGCGVRGASVNGDASSSAGSREGGGTLSVGGSTRVR